MLTVVIVIHLMIVIALICLVLLQKSEGGGLGMGSSGGGFLTSRGTANVLTRATALLAVGFFLTSLALSWIASLDRKPSSILNTGGAPISQPETPAGPSAPLSQPGGGGLLNQLRGGGEPQGGGQPQPPAPPPGGPQVPQSQ
jgi:preprotein translocase subunit SecG